MKARSLVQISPPDFKLPSQKTAAEQLLGNAVPVYLAQAVVDAIMAYEQISRRAVRGRKSASDKICGVDRELFMRTLVREGSNVKYAKDTWSWLQRASSYIDAEQLDGDADDVIYNVTRSVTRNGRGGDKTLTTSRVKKSLAHFLSVRSRLSDAKRGCLDLF